MDRRLEHDVKGRQRGGAVLLVLGSAISDKIVTGFVGWVYDLCKVFDLDLGQTECRRACRSALNVWTRSKVTNMCVDFLPALQPPQSLKICTIDSLQKSFRHLNGTFQYIFILVI